MDSYERTWTKKLFHHFCVDIWQECIACIRFTIYNNPYRWTIYALETVFFGDKTKYIFLSLMDLLKWLWPTKLYHHMAGVFVTRSTVPPYGRSVCYWINYITVPSYGRSVCYKVNCNPYRWKSIGNCPFRRRQDKRQVNFKFRIWWSVAKLV